MPDDEKGIISPFNEVYVRLKSVYEDAISREKGAEGSAHAFYAEQAKVADDLKKRLLVIEKLLASDPESLVSQKSEVEHELAKIASELAEVKLRLKALTLATLADEALTRAFSLLGGHLKQVSSVGDTDLPPPGTKNRNVLEFATEAADGKTTYKVTFLDDAGHSHVLVDVTSKKLPLEWAGLVELTKDLNRWWDAQKLTSVVTAGTLAEREYLLSMLTVRGQKVHLFSKRGDTYRLRVVTVLGLES